MKKLYDENAYAREFDAVVTAVAEGDDGASVWLTLDATLFFPEEGGQSPDRGTIDGRTVTDVQITDGEVRHRVNIDPDGAGALYRTGMTVHGIIDWEYRYRNMQMHTGEHIFSGLVHSLYGYDNVGFHLSDRTATMDYNGKLTEQQLLKLEERVNRIITENRAVQAWYPAPGELEILSYRSKKAIDGAVRLVEIDGVDLCACCAPHVKVTGEVGCFKLIGWENYKGGVRVSYRCGFRAMEDYGERLALLSKLSQTLSVKTEDLCATVEKLRDERKRLAYELVAKDRAIVRSLIAETAAAETGERAEDGRIAGPCVLFLEAADSSLLRYAVDELKACYAGVVCALLPVEGNALSWRYLIEQDGGDVSAWQQLLRERFGAKGGGPKNSVQGSVTAEETALRSALASL
jgi:Predicted metal-dependent hydrolases related to alanyl-tRNA synthetase HxxxH domain